MSRIRWLYLAAALTLFLGGAAGAGGPDEKAPVCQNTLDINWVLPGEFGEARTRSQKENRLLMIKGIAFGIDEVGARNAKKGCW